MYTFLFTRARKLQSNHKILHDISICLVLGSFSYSTSINQRDETFWSCMVSTYVSRIVRRNILCYNFVLVSFATLKSPRERKISWYKRKIIFLIPPLFLSLSLSLKQRRPISISPRESLVDGQPPKGAE